ncbi:MAG TPA: homocysteine S-methyltransferase family protein [Steroidobacteraceae bacterium]
MNKHITVLDGGTGRELRRIGAPFQQPEWSALALLEGPQFVSRVHEAYIKAGADVITTNSYAVVPFHIGNERFAARGAELASLAGRLARGAADAASRKVKVAGSLPPICGSYRAEWFDPGFARPILSTLIEALRPSVDLWLAETLSSTEEALLVREVVGKDGLPLWLSFTLRDDKAALQEDPALRSGQTVREAVDVAIQLGAEALLFNCSQPEVMGAAIKVASKNLRGLKLGVYANAFSLQSEVQANEQLHDIRADLTPELYLNWIKDWIAAGADIVGGCCGIGPEHIEAIRASLRLSPS